MSAQAVAATTLAETAATNGVKTVATDSEIVATAAGSQVPVDAAPPSAEASSAPSEEAAAGADHAVAEEHLATAATVASAASAGITEASLRFPPSIARAVKEALVAAGIEVDDEGVSQSAEQEQQQPPQGGRCVPLLIFMNSKSGGGLGPKLLSKAKIVVGPVQVRHKRGGERACGRKDERMERHREWYSE